VRATRTGRPGDRECVKWVEPFSIHRSRDPTTSRVLPRLRDLRIYRAAFAPGLLKNRYFKTWRRQRAGPNWRGYTSNLTVKS
jgi:hypothetical protein